MPLPPGLALNPDTGVISGVPTTPGTFSFTLRVRDSQGLMRDIPSSITVQSYTPPSLSGTLATFSNRTVAYSSGLTVSGGTSPYTWSIAFGTLPAGLSINTSTGVISGTPTDTNYTDRSLAVRVVDANNSAVQSSQTIRYADVLSLSGSLPSGVQGQAYSAGFTRSGGHSAFGFAITSGALPEGLTMNTSTGVISGTPVATSSTSLTIRVTDAAGVHASASSTLTINSSYTPISITGSISDNTQNVETLSAFSITPNYNNVVVSGGSGTISYSWVRLSGSTAVSPGSSTTLATSFVGNCAPSSSVSAAFRVTASDGTSSATLDVTITVHNVYVTMAMTVSLPRVTRTVAYSHTLARTGGKSPYQFVVASGTLPSGLTLGSADGLISGTPTEALGKPNGDRTLTFRVTDALGAVVDASGGMIYRNPPTFSFSLPAAMRTRAYSASTAVYPPDSVHGPITASLVAGTLPAGLTLESGGPISGTPTDTSYTNRTLTVRATDVVNNIHDASATMVYTDNLVVSGSFATAGEVGVAYSSSTVTAAGGTTAYAWSVASGTLPAGLSLNSGTGVLSGTPTTAGSSSFVVRATDANGFTADSATQSISIAAALAVSITNQNIADSRVAGEAVASARYALLATGVAQAERSTGNTTISGEWLTGGNAANAQVRVTLVSGALSQGSTGTWLALTSDQRWEVNRSTAGTSAARITVEIRHATTLNVLGSATIDLTATLT